MKKISKGEDNMAIKPVSGEIKAQVLNDNFSALDSNLTNLSIGPFDTYTSLSALQSTYPNGRNGFAVVLEADGETGYMYTWTGTTWKKGGLAQSMGIADKTVGFNEIKDDGVNYNNADFISVSKNKMDLSKLQVDGFHNYTTGVWSPNTGFDTSGKIPCRPGQVWTSKFTRWVCHFDKDANFATGGFATGSADILKTFTIPPGVYAFEVTCQKHNTAKQQIEQSSILSDYNEFELKIDNLKIEIDSVNDIKNDSLTIDKMEFIETGKNLFNPNVAVTGYYINPTTGILNEAANYITSKLIPVYGRPIGLKNVRFYALFSKNGEYLSGETLSADKLIAENAINAFIRVSPNSGSEGSAQVEYDAITAFESYRAVLKGVSTESEVSDKPSINLPKNIFATTNKQLEIFKNNVTLDSDVDFKWGRGIQGAKSYRETFADTTSKNLSAELFKNGKLINSKPVSIKIANPRTTNLKVMLLGDSTVASATTEPASEARLGYHIIDEMGANVTLLGSRGVGTSKHEGRGGWTAKDYRSNKTDVTGTNPFYNATTSDFDFSYYMSQTSSDVPDAVVIQLGINDLFNYSTDGTALNKISEFISDINFIASNIKSFDSAINVVYNLAIPPTEQIDIFGETYQQYNLPQWRYKRNNHLLVNETIKALENSSTIILNAINKGIDVENNIRDGVHPTDSGYKQIASQIVDCLNNL